MPIAEDSAGGSPVPIPTNLTTNLTGEATGSGTLDYTTGDIDIAVTVVDNGHNHILSNITDVQVNNAISGQILVYNGTVWANATNTSGITAIVQDTSPQLGGNLDLNNRNITGTGNIAITGTIDGRDVSADGTKLDGIESGATADQTAAQIKTAYESNANTNNFADADVSKLSGIEPGATADQTAAQIKTAYESNADTNAFTDADHTKLDGIETAADVTDTTNVVASLTAGTNVTISAGGVISSTASGGLAHVVDDTTPQLGGNLDLNSNDITGTGNLNFTGSVTLSGTVDGRDVAADGTKLDGIEASADVTDTANVTAAGALMDSEVTNLAQVKAFDSSDYATAAQGTTADAALPKAGGTMTGDILFNDGVKAKYGNSSDLQIYHDSSNSYIKEGGTGNLFIDATSLRLRTGAGTETYLTADGNGSVDLYYDNVKKLETTSTGIDVTGDIDATGNVVSDGSLRFGSGGSYGAGAIYSDNVWGMIARSYTTNPVSGWDFLFNNSANVERMRLGSAGLRVTGNIELADNGKLLLGASDDLQIYHDGSNSYISDTGTGDVIVKGQYIRLQDEVGTNLLTADGNDAVSLYFGGASKLSTTTSGIDVTGVTKTSGSGYNPANTGWATNASLITSGSYGGGLTFLDGSAGYSIRVENSGADLVIGQGATSGALTQKVKIDANGLDVTGDINSTKSGGSTLTLENSITSISANELIGGIDFKGNDTSEDGNEVLAFIRAHALDTTPDSYIAFGTLQNNGGVDDVVTERMRLDNYGRLGIGTTTTNNNQAVIEGGVASTNGSSLALKTGNGTSGSVSDLAFYGTFVSHPDTNQRRTADITSGYSTANWGTEYLAFGVGTGGSNDSAVVTTERMRISGNGNVGVGLSAPTAKMHLFTDGIDQSMFSAQADLGVQNRILTLKSPVSDSSSQPFRWQTSNSILWEIDTTETKSMNLNSAGNLGLGTYSPSVKLDCAGSAKFNDSVEIQADSGFAFMEMGGPSGAFIDLKSPFSDDYDLRLQQDGSQSKLRTLGTSVQIDTSSGYVHIGPQNTSYCHFTTDRTRYYFNQNLVVAGNRVVSSYGGDLLLQRGQSSTQQISLGLSQVVMTGQLNIAGANPSSNNGAFEVPVISSSTPAIVSVSAGTTSLRTHHSFENSNGQVGKINTLGTQTIYSTSSDYRLKTDVQPMQGSIDRVKALKPCNFEWITDGTRVDGFIAHEAQEVVPESVIGEKDGMRDKVNIITPLVEATYDQEGNELTAEIPAVTETEQVPDYQGIDQSKIVPLLTSALQDAIAKIEALETRLEALES